MGTKVQGGAVLSLYNIEEGIILIEAHCAGRMSEINSNINSRAF